MAKVGTPVLYTLNAADAEAINRRRSDYDHFLRTASREQRGEGALTGPQGHVGNHAAEGEQYPAVIVRVFNTEGTTANLQVHLDGNDTYWATSRCVGDGPGYYELADDVNAPTALESAVITGLPAENLRASAAYIAADMAKTLTPRNGETIESRVDEVLAAAEKAHAWLTDVPGTSA